MLDFFKISKDKKGDPDEAYKEFEDIYTFDGKMKLDKGLIGGIINHSWQHLMNSKALRNRIKLFKEQLRMAIFSSLHKNCILIILIFF